MIVLVIVDSLADERDLSPRGGGDSVGMSEISCSACGATFASRNALFRHLRADDASCGDVNDVASTSSASTQVDGASRLASKSELGVVFARLSGTGVTGGQRKKEKDMTKDEVRALNERRRERAARRRNERATWASDEDALERELWIGGLRGKFRSFKGFRDAIWRAMPREGCEGIPVPQARVFKARGYKEKGEWVGYGFAACRDPGEAKALLVMHGTEIVDEDSGAIMVLKVLPATRRHAGDKAKTPTKSRELKAGEHPNERDIFIAWTSKTLERRALDRGITSEELVTDALEREHAYVALRGVEVDRTATERLRDELLDTKWPAQSQRRSVKSDNYIVLKRECSPSDPYESLKLACEDLMRAVDPSFPYDSLAITKNFISSAHLDKEDQSFQYAMAFGDFTGGGELCVESSDGLTRYAIDTRERLARFDGRCVHWVRGYEGERFSVVWYVNRRTNFTEPRFDVDLSFVAQD